MTGTAEQAQHAHRRLQRLQFSLGAGGGLHQYSKLVLNKDTWTSSVGERMPSSYQRIMTMQPLPSTASLCLTNAQRGLSLDAAVQRAEAEKKVHEWADFASEYVQARSTLARAQNGAAADCGEKADRRVASFSQASTQSMFDQLRQRKRREGEPQSSAVQREISGSASHAPRRLKTKIVKKQEFVEAKSKRKAIWYNLPEGSSLVASDQSASAARISIVLTALAEVRQRSDPAT
jgi:hypothetical protein